MWFKRKKLTERDPALSQSLKSLQSLLNETERREPSLEAPGSEPDAKAPRELAAAGEPRAPHEHKDAGPKAPAAPDSANRWQDLNLSFDAEPAAPQRLRHGSDADAADRKGGGAAPSASDKPGQGNARPVARHLRLREAARRPVEAASENTDEQDNGATDIKTENTGSAADSEPADGAPINVEESSDPRAEAVSPAPDQEPAADGARNSAASRHDAGTRSENQLHLELEPDEETDDTIPTLTQAVYVPTPPQGERQAVELHDPDTQEPPSDERQAAELHDPDTQEPPSDERQAAELHDPDTQEPPSDEHKEVETNDADIEFSPLDEREEIGPHDEDIERCLEGLRSRLQHMEVDMLSSEQEAQLRAILSEYLDEKEFD